MISQDELKTTENLKYKYKMLMLGSEGVGKIPLAREYSALRLEGDYIKAFGVDFEKYNVNLPELKIGLTIWNLSCEQKFEKIREVYSKGAAVCLLVYDITRKSSLYDVFTGRIVKGLECKRLLDKSILVGNKHDLGDQRKVTPEEGIEFAKRIGCRGYVEVSDKTGYNVKELLNFASFLPVYKQVPTVENYQILGKFAKKIKGEKYLRLKSKG